MDFSTIRRSTPCPVCSSEGGGGQTQREAQKVPGVPNPRESLECLENPVRIPSSLEWDVRSKIHVYIYIYIYIYIYTHTYIYLSGLSVFLLYSYLVSGVRVLRITAETISGVQVWSRGRVSGEGIERRPLTASAKAEAKCR